jgi:glycolate oxidase FAD binding subunit
MKGQGMRPATEAELSDLIRGAEGPLAVVGGGTRRLAETQGVLVEAGGLSGVELYEPGALTLVARAGTPLAEIEALLATERQRLAFEVPDLRALLGRKGSSTLGGAVASNASGPRRLQVGACRDAVLGLRFVDGTGMVIKNGGRVMKNVTGYDLAKLLAGSHGALGVITEVALKVQALPEAEVTLLSDQGVEAGLASLRAALGTPFDLSGAAYAGGRAMLRLEGMAGSVAYRARALQQRLGGDWAQLSGAESAALWAEVRDVTGFADKPGAVWRLAVKPTEAARVAGVLGGEALFDWGGGLIWLLTQGGRAAAVRAAVAGIGHATLARPAMGDEDAAILPPEPAEVAALTAGLRARFDPKGLFSTGGQV